MKLRRAVSYAVAGIGSAAVATRTLQARAGELEPPLEGEPHTYRWRGMDVSYFEAGDPDDRTVVFLHGVSAAASSHEFHEVFEALADDYHVIAPDLPGFGTSDRPALRYSATLYEDFVSDFLAELDDPVVVASSLTGAYATAAASRQDIARLVLISPTTTTIPGHHPWARELLRTPVVGTALFYAIVSKPAIRYFNQDHGYYDPAHLDEETVEYEWRSAHQPGSRFAHAAFMAGDLNSDLDLETELAALDVPITLVWGREAEKNPIRNGQELADAADCQLVVFDNARLVPHAEYPEQFVETLREEILGD